MSAFEPSVWAMVKPLGVCLTGRPWPPDELGEILDQIHRDVCVGLGYCGPLGPPSSYDSSLNDLDRFTAEVLRRLGVDVASPSYEKVIAHLHTNLRIGFKLDLE
jgi:hypothetical protein